MRVYKTIIKTEEEEEGGGGGGGGGRGGGGGGGKKMNTNRRVCADYMTITTTYITHRTLFSRATLSISLRTLYSCLPLWCYVCCWS